jgi:hypothetical protein
LPFPSASHLPTFRLFLECVLFSLSIRLINSSSLEKVTTSSYIVFFIFYILFFVFHNSSSE